jgi:hypothetical protein
LAKNEEARFTPEDYNYYRQSTGMFLPRLRGLKANRNTHDGIKNSGVRVGVAYVLSMGISIGLGFALRAFTVEQLPQVYLENLRVVSVKQMPGVKLKSIVQAVLADSAIKSQLDSQSTYLAYLMPQHYKMSALIARVPDEKKQDVGRFHFMTNIFHMFVMGLQKECCLKNPGTDALRIILLKISHVDNRPISPAQVFDIYTKRTPILYADIEPHTEKVLRQQQLPPGNKWGGLPQAIF